MTQQLHPDPEFVAGLENQLTTEYRRLERLGWRDRTGPDFARWLRAGGFLLAGLLIGCASITTAQRIDRAADLEELRHHAEASVRIATQRVEANRRILDLLMRGWESGTVVMSNSLLYSARGDVVEAETALRLAELDVEQLDAGADPSRTEVSAPRAGGRDFFSERLQIELDANAERASGLGQIIEFMEARVNAGLELSRDLMPLTIERERLAIDASRIGETLALRQSFLDGGIGADEAELRQRLLQTDARRQSAQAALDYLRARNEFVRQRYATGVISEDELVAAERDLLQAEAAVQLAELETELVARRLEF